MKRLLHWINNYLVFFLLTAFLVTCCLMLFTNALMDSLDIVLTSKMLETAAKLTFANVLLLSLLYTCIDALRRRLTVERTSKRIAGAAQKIMAGDFSVRIDQVSPYGMDQSFVEIIDCFNTMAQELSGVENLRTDYLDLYYLHRVNVQIPVEEVAKVMGKFIAEGLIKGWGLSQVSLETLKKAHEITPVTALQSLYNMLERDLEDEIFPYCLENGITVVPFSPVASGYLSGKIQADTQFEKVDDVRNWVPQLSKENIIGNQPVIDIISEYAARKNATNAQISIAWILHKYPNAVPIPGSKNQERILENLGSWDVALSDEEMAALDAALASCKIHGHRGVVEMAGMPRPEHR